MSLMIEKGELKEKEKTSANSKETLCLSSPPVRKIAVIATGVPFVRAKGRGEGGSRRRKNQSPP